MSMYHTARHEVSKLYARHLNFSRALDRLNRLPLLRDFTGRFPEAPRFPTREAMWDFIAARYAGPIDYLEFGVHEGHSILHWAGANTAAESRFVGFDTFRGLPEAWNRVYGVGHFSTNGEVPLTSDPRVHFVQGLFQDTLADFLKSFVPTHPLVVHIDSDLYSSALFCLTQLDAYLAPGSVIIFDEFGDVQHEFRAVNDYAASYRRDFRLICTHDSFFTAAIEMI